MGTSMSTEVLVNADTDGNLLLFEALGIEISLQIAWVSFVNTNRSADGEK